MKKLVVVFIALLTCVSVWSQEKAGILYGSQHIVLDQQNNSYAWLTFDYVYEGAGMGGMGCEWGFKLLCNSKNTIKDIKIYIGDNKPYILEKDSFISTPQDGGAIYCAQIDPDIIDALINAEDYTIKINYFDENDNIASVVITKNDIGSVFNVLTSFYESNSK